MCFLEFLGGWFGLIGHFLKVWGREWYIYRCNLQERILWESENWLVWQGLRSCMSLEVQVGGMHYFLVVRQGNEVGMLLVVGGFRVSSERTSGNSGQNPVAVFHGTMLCDLFLLLLMIKNTGKTWYIHIETVKRCHDLHSQRLHLCTKATWRFRDHLPLSWGNGAHPPKVFQKLPDDGDDLKTVNLMAESRRCSWSSQSAP